MVISYIVYSEGRNNEKCPSEKKGGGELICIAEA